MHGLTEVVSVGQSFLWPRCTSIGRPALGCADPPGGWKDVWVLVCRRRSNGFPIEEQTRRAHQHDVTVARWRWWQVYGQGGMNSGIGLYQQIKLYSWLLAKRLDFAKHNPRLTIFLPETQVHKFWGSYLDPQNLCSDFVFS